VCEQSQNGNKKIEGSLKGLIIQAKPFRSSTNTGQLTDTKTGTDAS